GVVEDAADVVGEVGDGDPRRVAWRCGSAVAAIMRVQREATGEVVTKKPPHVTVATNAVAQDHRRECATVPPRLVENRTTVGSRDGIPPCRRAAGRHAVTRFLSRLLRPGTRSRTDTS